MFHIKIILNLIFLLFITEYSSRDLLLSVKLLKEQVEKFGEEKFRRIFNEDNLNKHYLSLYKSNMYKLIPVNETKIVNRFSQQLEKELRKKMEALKKTVEFAEDQAMNYKWNPLITTSDVNYINSKKLEPNDSSLHNSSLFKSKIIINKSSVHIPTEIYDGDETILNTIKWTESLDKAFVNNLNELRYQYFASYTGIVVQFPGMMWRNKELDMYDVRRRPWFVQGASSPKDIMILIDTSGSMTGISLQITMIAVKKLIDTMGENDYLAVAQFPGNTKENATNKPSPHLLMSSNKKNSFSPCFKGFVQANKRNKEIIFNQITALKALGIADLTEALEFAIEEFQKMDNNSRPYEGTNCNRIILVLTDGNDEHRRDKIKELMDKSPLTQNIRIFIYSIGEEIAPIDALYRMTCDYRGFFGHVRSIGAVNNIIDKFISVVHTQKIHQSNPLGNNEFRVIVSNIVQDEFLDHNDFPPQGLGLMTSLTMPVYNRSGNGTFLGLLGTDMTVDFMNHLVPRDKLGPNGYAFAINTNGFIIFHPELKVQRGWMRDPPNVDLIEVEFNSGDKTKIRTDIINCAGSNGTGSGEMSVKSFIKVLDEIHTYEKVRKYTYHGIPLSTFGVAIVNPTFNKFYVEVNENVKFDKLIHCDNAQCIMNVTIHDKSKKTIIFSKDIHIYAETGVLARCKILEEDVQQHIQNSNSLSYPSSTFLPNTSSRLLPISTFGSTISTAITMSGNVTMRSVGLSPMGTVTDNQTVFTVVPRLANELIRLLVLSETDSTNLCPILESRRLVVDLIILEEFVNSLDLLSLEKSVKSIAVAMVSGITLVYPESEKYVYKDLFHSSWNSAIFQRAYDMDKLIFYTPLHRNGKSTHNDVMIFKAFSPDHSSEQIIPGAVLGITVNQSSIIDLLRSSDGCNDGRVCYVIEDGGYIVSISEYDLIDEVGYFFGDKHTLIMRTLINNSIFLAVEEFDYQASCPRQNNNDQSASSSRLLQILTALPMTILQILLNSISTILTVIRLSIQLLLISQSHAQESTAANNENVSCIQKNYRYYLPDDGDLGRVIELSCGQCNFTVVSQRLDKANLILVSFDRNCSSHCDQINVPALQTMPVQDPGPDVCAHSLEPNYRMRPNYTCHTFDPTEDFTHCLSPLLRFSRTSLLISVAMLLKGL